MEGESLIGRLNQTIPNYVHFNVLEGQGTHRVSEGLLQIMRTWSGPSKEHRAIVHTQTAHECR
eukprot:1160286-Pelagomonas_calceolata.AAC.1